MGQFHSREIVLLASTTATTNGTGSDIVIPSGWQAAKIILNTSAASGTSPTLNAFVQDKLPQPAAGDLTGSMPTGTAVYDDVLAFTQMTTTGKTQICRVATNGQTPTANATVSTTADYPILTGALTAGNARVGPITGTWRAAWNVGGTSPSFTFSITAQLVPYST